VRNPTDLADLVAQHIAHVEGKACNKSTLLRNGRYKAKILTYQAMRLVPGASAPNRTAVNPAAQALIMNAQLDSANRSRELERLKIYVRSLENQLDLLQSRDRGPATPAAAKFSTAELSDYEFRFIRTCQTLRSLISHLGIVVQLDTSNQRIIDMSKRRDNVIVESELAGPFFEWLTSQRRLGPRSGKQEAGGGLE
jgi:hypothetical protein